MTELVEWYEAQLAEDERIAKAAKGQLDGRWRHSGGEGIPHLITRQNDRWNNSVVVYDEGSPNDDEADHIALHDPRSVLADIAAKRQVIALLGVAEQHLEERRRNAPHYRLVVTAEIPRDALFLAVQHLASTHAHRPGWDPRWAPQ